MLLCRMYFLLSFFQIKFKLHQIVIRKKICVIIYFHLKFINIFIPVKFLNFNFNIFFNYHDYLL